MYLNRSYFQTRIYKLARTIKNDVTKEPSKRNAKDSNQIFMIIGKYSIAPRVTVLGIINKIAAITWAIPMNV